MKNVERESFAEAHSSPRLSKWHTPEERFWAKVTFPETSCFLWAAKLDRNGYGLFTVPTKKAPVFAHRFAYELQFGPIPAGMVLDHLCRNPACVNPAHLEPVTNRENILRGTGPTARNAAKTHCKRGHEFTPENTRIYKDARTGTDCRRCRTCEVAYGRQRNARLKAARASATDDPDSDLGVSGLC